MHLTYAYAPVANDECANPIVDTACPNMCTVLRAGAAALSLSDNASVKEIEDVQAGVGVQLGDDARSLGRNKRDATGAAALQKLKDAFTLAEAAVSNAVPRPSSTGTANANVEEIIDVQAGVKAAAQGLRSSLRGADHALQKLKDVFMLAEAAVHRSVPRPSSAVQAAPAEAAEHANAPSGDAVDKTPAPAGGKSDTSRMLVDAGIAPAVAAPTAAELKPTTTPPLLDNIQGVHRLNEVMDYGNK